MAASSAPVYAFAGWVASALVYLIFLAWALAPDAALRRLGVTYYPARYYALALPACLLVLAVLASVAYMAVNMMRTNGPGCIGTVRDEHSRRAPTLARQLASARSIPEIGDSDIRYISYRFAQSSLQDSA